MAFGAEGAGRVAWTVRESRVSELIFASNIVPSSDPELVGPYAEWRARQAEELPAQAIAYLGFAARELGWATLSLCDFVERSGIYDDWPAFAAAVAAAPVDEFLYVLLNEDIPADRVAEFLGDPARAPEWKDRLSALSRMSEAAILKIFREPEEFRRRLLDYVGANDTPAFRESLVAKENLRSARLEELRARLRSADPLQVARSLAKNAAWDEAGCRSCTFVPSRFLGGVNLASRHGDGLLVFFDALSVVPPPSEDSRSLAQDLKVLGDKTRLDILRRLSEAPSYCKELAHVLELSPATISRQLDQLKAAGLVDEEPPDAANVKLVRLVPSATVALFERLKAFLESAVTTS